MISVIITDYKSMEFTFDYIQKMIEQFGQSQFHFLVVDNSNENDGANFIKQRNFSHTVSMWNEIVYYNISFEGENIILIVSPENGGYSRGNNLGVKVSKNLFNDKYYLFSNNDLVYPKDFSFDDLLKVFNDHSNIGIVGPTIHSPRGDIQSPRKILNFWKQMLFQDYNYWWFGGKFKKYFSNIDYSEREGLTGWVSGSLMLVNSLAFESCSGFDENIFLYCEEMTISERMRNVGFNTYFLPTKPIVHYHRGASEYSKVAERRNRQSMYYFYKTYRNITTLSIFISELSFKFCKSIYNLKKRMDKIIS